MENARRRRFIAWFEARYGDAEDARARFMRESGERGSDPLSKGRVTQLFDESESFGEVAARNLAERFGLPEDFFEHDEGATPVFVSEDERPLVLAYLDGLRGSAGGPPTPPKRRRNPRPSAGMPPRATTGKKRGAV